MAEGLDCSNVEITVREGIVTLTGDVAARADKHRIEQIAADVSGVKDVENQLRMGKPDSSGLSESKTYGRSDSSGRSDTSSSSGTTGSSGVKSTGESTTTGASSKKNW